MTLAVTVDQDNATHARSIASVDDMAMIRTAAKITRDLSKPKAAIYWPDFLISAAIGYAAMAGAIVSASTLLAVLSGLVAVIALYRAGSFIHELTHVKRSQLPGFHAAWNAIVGVPLFFPSFLYEGVHSLHHARIRYGTIEDPEYLPLALMKPWTVPLFVLASALAPIAMLIRFGLLTPLSLLIPPLRRFVVARWSGLIINPAFRRRPEKGEVARAWKAQETATCLWSITVVALVATGIIPLRAFGIYLAIVSAVMVLNQLRTLVAHLWENEGDEMNQTQQYLDSVNVPPPGFLPELWAPVGLRYHALHHLLPALPYHSLGEAHRRLAAALDLDSSYHGANQHGGLPKLVARLVRSTFGQR